MGRTNIKVETKKEIEGLENLKGVYEIEEIDNSLEFKVDDSEKGKVISHISNFDITNLVCAPPTLEELFMTHYNNRGDE